MVPHGFEDKVAFVWRVADKLRGTFKQHEYGSVMLPLLVLRRMDAVLAPTKEAVVEKARKVGQLEGGARDLLLRQASGRPFYNTSALTFSGLLNDDKNLADNLGAYIRGLSPHAYAVIEAYNFDGKIQRMDHAGILYQVVADFADLDLHPDAVSNEAMGYIFEELLRKFSEMSNETAGEHYTPREVIRLMADLLVAGKEADSLTGAQVPVRTIYDPAAGTGGMLMITMERIKELNPAARVEVFGQELNDETWAIAQSDLMMQNVEPDNMQNGNSLTDDAFRAQTFDFILANPPYGVDWKAYARPIKDEHERLGMNGRFGAGLPRVSDGSLLFLQHMISKMKPSGSRIGIVLSGSPLFSGAAGSGESEIRRWILENDWLEGIVALPDQMFYNTGISTYVWVLTNAKAEADAGVVRLIDAREMGTKMRKSLGDKRKELTNDAISQIVQLYGGALDEFREDSRVRVLARETFGFQRVTVERPLHRRWEVGEEAKALIDGNAKTYGAMAPLVGRRFDMERKLTKAMADQVVLSAAAKRKFVAACAVTDPRPRWSRRRARPNPTRTCATRRTSPCPRAGSPSTRTSGNACWWTRPRSTWHRRFTPTCPMRGSTTQRRSWASRFPSRGSSTCMSRHGPWRRSQPRSRSWKLRSKSG